MHYFEVFYYTFLTLTLGKKQQQPQIKQIRHLTSSNNEIGDHMQNDASGQQKIQGLITSLPKSPFTKRIKPLTMVWLSKFYHHEIVYHFRILQLYKNISTL